MTIGAEGVRLWQTKKKNILNTRASVFFFFFTNLMPLSRKLCRLMNQEGLGSITISRFLSRHGQDGDR